MNEQKIREEMLRLTKELGTTCAECHNLSNFKSSDRPSFKIAAQHMQVVTVLKANGFDGVKGPLASCKMCHRGELKPK